MKNKEELELILSLIKKYNLPLSPILDYAIKEKIEEISEPSPFELSEDVSIDDNSVKDFEDFKIKQENTFVENTNDNFNDIEIEHVKLKPHGNVISDSSLHTDNNLDQNDSIDNRKGKPWTENEEKTLTYFFKQGRDVATLAKLFGRTEVAIKSRLGKLGLIEYTYGQEDVASTQTTPTAIEQPNEKDYTIENTLVRSSILNRYGERVFITDGKLKYIHEKLYRLNLKRECFTVKIMQFDGTGWVKGVKKIVAYPLSDLYRIIEDSPDYCVDIEDIVDSLNFVECKLKVRGVWYSYNGNIIKESSQKSDVTSEYSKQGRDVSDIKKDPLYAVRRQAILRALDHFRLPVSIKDISRAISRTAWRTNILEEDVKVIISTMFNVVCIEGKYILRSKL